MSDSTLKSGRNLRNLLLIGILLIVALIVFFIVYPIDHDDKIENRILNSIPVVSQSDPIDSSRVCDMYYLPGLDHADNEFYFELSSDCEFDSAAFTIQVIFKGSSHLYETDLHVTDKEAHTIELQAPDYESILEEVIYDVNLRQAEDIAALSIDVLHIRSHGRDDVLFRGSPALGKRIEEDISARFEN
jgi:hypothetical protein